MRRWLLRPGEEEGQAGLHVIFEIDQLDSGDLDHSTGSNWAIGVWPVGPGTPLTGVFQEACTTTGRGLQWVMACRGYPRMMLSQRVMQRAAVGSCCAAFRPRCPNLHKTHSVLQPFPLTCRHVDCPLDTPSQAQNLVHWPGSASQMPHFTQISGPISHHSCQLSSPPSVLCPTDVCVGMC